MADDPEAPPEIGAQLAPYVVSPKLDQLLQGDAEAAGGRSLKAAGRALRVIIEANLERGGTAEECKAHILGLLKEAGVPNSRIRPIDLSYQYIFARLRQKEVVEVIRLDLAQTGADPRLRAIWKIWPDEPLTAYINRSIRTVKADACRVAFGAEGAGIIWAVADSGIDATHPHFDSHATLRDLPGGLEHRNFLEGKGDPLEDVFGHGTHVAGILAGETERRADRPIYRMAQRRDERSTIHATVDEITTSLRGVAPLCKILSLKVIDDRGEGHASNLIAALEYVARLNGDGRKLRVHGVNLSLGYPFETEWYAAGHSPLCQVVNRLSRDGVVVVAAAGNDGSAFVQSASAGTMKRVGIDQSINDPGNAEEAITVGATHAEEPHTYGVSFFSSRGPTADGRVKPDLVAPGEKILSCTSALWKGLKDKLDDAGHKARADAVYFREESGTSMAAPHVSGAIAALMSVKPEVRGNPKMVKEILLGSCTDLGRKADFQGAGLLDLFRAIQLK